MNKVIQSEAMRQLLEIDGDIGKMLATGERRAELNNILCSVRVNIDGLEAGIFPDIAELFSDIEQARRRVAAIKARPEEQDECYYDNYYGRK